MKLEYLEGFCRPKLLVLNLKCKFAQPRAVGLTPMNIDAAAQLGLCKESCAKELKIFQPFELQGVWHLARYQVYC